MQLAEPPRVEPFVEPSLVPSQVGNVRLCFLMQGQAAQAVRAVSAWCVGPRLGARAGCRMPADRPQPRPPSQRVRSVTVSRGRLRSAPGPPSVRYGTRYRRPASLRARNTAWRRAERAEEREMVCLGALSEPFLAQIWKLSVCGEVSTPRRAYRLPRTAKACTLSLPNQRFH